METLYKIIEINNRLLKDEYKKNRCNLYMSFMRYPLLILLLHFSILKLEKSLYIYFERCKE